MLKTQPAGVVSRFRLKTSMLLAGLIAMKAVDVVVSSRVYLKAARNMYGMDNDKPYYVCTFM